MSIACVCVHPPAKCPRYHAGQYLLLQRPDGEMSAFSLASAPHAGRELELHILAREEGSIALLQHLRSTGMARVQMPYGDTHLADLPDGPLVLIAAGTGMGQMHSLIEHCRAAGFAHPVHLYWGARRPEDFYQLPHWAEWQQLDNLHLHQVVSDQCGWQGRCGLLHEAVREDFPQPQGLARLRQRLAGDGLRHARCAGGSRHGRAPDARRRVRLRAALEPRAIRQACQGLTPVS
jgi:CDP-4-dehydro-6-deoxyglucose reductase